MTTMHLPILLLLLLASGLAMASLSDDDEVQQLCPSQCTCFDKRDDVTVQCKLTNKLQIPPVLPPKTKHLDLSGIPLCTLDADSFQNPNLAQLRTLDLSHCSLTYLAPKVFNKLIKLQSVHLNDNNLTKSAALEVLMYAKSLPHVHFHLDGNLFDCYALKKRKQNRNIVCDPGRTKKPNDDDVSSTTVTHQESTSVKNDVTVNQEEWSSGHVTDALPTSEAVTMQGTPSTVTAARREIEITATVKAIETSTSRSSVADIEVTSTTPPSIQGSSDEGLIVWLSLAAGVLAFALLGSVLYHCFHEKQNRARVVGESRDSAERMIPNDVSDMTHSSAILIEE